VKFVCERSALAEAVGAAHRAVASRTGALPVLSGVQVTFRPGEIEFTGSDLELTIRARVHAQVEGEGTAVLVARLLVDTLSKLSAETVTVEIVDDQAKIECGRFRSEVRTLAAADFPRLPEPDGTAVTVDAVPLARGLKQVVPAASRDDARPILTGVLVASTAEGVRLVATDSYRLAVSDLAGLTVLPEGRTVLVGAKGLGELQRLLGDGTVEVYLGERYVTFRLGSTDLTARLIEGDFPNYQQLIPSGYPNRLTVERDALAQAVERVSLVGGVNRDSAPIKLTMTAEGLELSATAQDVGQSYEPVEAKYAGSDVTVAFNARFLLEGLEATGSDEVTIESVDPLKPAVLRGADAPGFLYLLMPVRIA
jgi:DNA polymerase-3 subunit beta